jgi:hypothetical protein
MNEEERLKLYARLAAIEYMLAEAFRMIYGILGVSEKPIEETHEELRRHLQTMKIPTDDPDIAALVAGELEEAHTKLLTMIANAVRDRKNATD